MAQTQTVSEIKALFSKAGLDYDQVRARGFDSYQMAEIQKGLEAGVEVTGFLDPEMPWTEMEEYRLELEQGIDLSMYRNKGFSADKLSQIREGLAEGVDVSLYASQDYLAEQMKEIREGLVKGIPVMFYQDPAYNYMQMAEIRTGLEHNVDISKYLNSKIPYRKMRAIRESMEQGVYLDDDVIEKYDAGVISAIASAKTAGIDVTEFAAKGYDADQLEEIKLSIEHKAFDFKRFIDRQYRGESLKEIRIGVEEGLDVSHYAKVEYSWEQMREIRLGLEARVDTTIYEKPLYRAQQMREIRKGLEQGLDVSYYTSMVYSSKEMRMRRKAIESVIKDRGSHVGVEEALGNTVQGVNTADTAKPAKLTREQKIKTGFPFVTVSDDGLKADIYIPFKVGQPEYNMEDVNDVLTKNHIVYGIDYGAVADLIEKKLYNRDVTIAKGMAAKPGKDGYYEYSFEPKIPTAPSTMPDLSLLYEDVKFFEKVNAGDKLAEYHEAEFGNEGCTVLGEKIKSIKGRELPILKGVGIMMMNDRKSWCSTISGEVRIRNYEISIRPLQVIPEARDPKAQHQYPGSVLVEGNVTKGVTIKAKGDIVVKGKIDGARLDADGNIYVVGGCMGSAERSLLRAGGIIASPHMSNTDARADGSISANQVMDCNLITLKRVNIAGQRGSIAGGEIQAQLGISCAVLGTIGKKRTIVQLGATGELQARYSDRVKAISRVEAELTLLRSERDRLNGLANNAVKTQNQIRVAQALAIKENEQNEIIEEKAQLEERMKKIAGAKARISHIVYSGVIIIIDGFVKQVNEDMTNPDGLLFKNGGQRVSVSRHKVSEEILGISAYDGDYDEDDI